MADPRFYRPLGPLGLDTLANLVGAELLRSGSRTRAIAGVGPLEAARADEIAFVGGHRFLQAASASEAGALLIAPELADRISDEIGILAVGKPALALAAAAAHLVEPIGEHWPGAGEPQVSPQARLDAGVTIATGAVVAAGAEIGAGSLIAPGAMIGPGVTVGRDCSIGPHVMIVCTHLGDRVVVKAGARLGSTGFGFQPGPAGLVRMPQIGRLIVQDDVEIGANTTIDRGSLGDTVIGAGTKIDNLVQIGHNCQIGRHCVLAGQVGLAGSTILGDFVMLGGQVGVNGHLSVGDGVQAAAQTGIAVDVAPGSRIGGTPARPVMQWKREMALLKRLVTRVRSGGAGKDA